MKVLFGLIKLVRPLNVFIGCLSIFVGGIVSGKPTELSEAEWMYLLCAVLAGGLVMAAGNVTNDYFDRDLDKLLKPERPIPSGVITPWKALLFGILLFFSGTIISIVPGLTVMAVTLLAVVLLLLYNTSLKKLPLIGNVTVSFLTGLAFVYGGIAVRSFVRALIPGTFAFFFNLGREILKDIEDSSGDRQKGHQTLPVILGSTESLALSGICFLAVLVISIIPYAVGFFGLRYMIMLIFGVYSVVFYCFFRLYGDRSPYTIANVSSILKWDMLIGLVCVIVGFYEFDGGW